MDLPFFYRCLLEVTFISLDDFSLQFVRICDFAPEVTRSMNLLEAEESFFYANIGSDNIWRWDCEMVMWVEPCWMGGLEDNLRGVCRMSFGYPFVVAVDFLGSVRVMSDIQGYFDAVALAVTLDAVGHFFYLLHGHVPGLPYSSSFLPS